MTADRSATRAAPAGPTRLLVSAGRPCPLLPIALALAAGMYLSQLVAVPGQGLLVVVGLSSAVAAGVTARRGGVSGRTATGWLLVAAVAAGFARARAATTRGAACVARQLSAEPCLTRLSGRVVSPPVFRPAERRNPFLPYEPAPRTRFLLAAEAWQTGAKPARAEGLIQVYVKGDARELSVGDEITVAGRLYRISGPRNPGEVDWARWARLQGIDAGLSVENTGLIARVGGPRSRFRRLLDRARGGARGLLCDALGDDPQNRAARLLDTMVLGNRSAAGRDLNEAFLRTGTIHFLTVSGFHVGVLAAAVWWIVRRILRRGRRSAAVATLLVLAAYALLVEPRAPVFRAAVMGAVLCAGQLLRRPTCLLNWLALAASCILVVNPLELFRPGFQLSFVQVLAIVAVVGPLLTRLARRTDAGGVPVDAESARALLLKRSRNMLLGLGLVCVTAWLVSLPLVLLHFRRFAPLGALQSILISPLVVVTVVLGFAALATAPIPLVGAGVGGAAAAASRALLWVVDQLARIPGALVETAAPPVWLVAGTYGAMLLLFGLASGWGERGGLFRRRLALALSGVVGCAWLGWGLFRPPAWAGQCVVYVLSVGSGGAGVIRSPDNHAALADVGTIHNFDAGAVVLRSLRTLGAERLDAVAVSHANFDHYSGVPAVLEAFPATPLITNPWFAARSAEDRSVHKLFAMLPAGIRHRTLRAGDTLAVGSLSVEVLWPPAGDRPRAVNDRSLVLRLRAFGHSVLFPGDIGREAEAGLLDARAAGRVDLRADVLVAPHHGAVVPTSRAFYEAVGPRVVVNSSNRDRPRLRALLAELPHPPRLINTHRAGAVRIRITPAGTLRVETPLAASGGPGTRD